MTATRFSLPMPVGETHPAPPVPVERKWPPARRRGVRWRLEIQEIRIFASFSNAWPPSHHVVDAYGASQGLCDEAPVGLLIDFRI
jgi:hypothetical protein